MRVLITGGGGQLAGSLRETAPAQCDVLAPKRQELDICEPAQIDSVLSGFQPDVLINTAAYTAVDRAESDMNAAWRVNHIAPQTIARACRAAGIHLMHVSTDYVFDGNRSPPVPYSPHDEISPLGVYGESKAAGEQAVLGDCPDALVMRTAWVYSRQGNNFVNTMLSLLSERDEVSVVKDQVGGPTWAGNLARVLWAFVDRPASGIFHYTDAGIASWYDLAVAVAEEGQAAGILSARARILPVETAAFPRPAPRPQFSVLDCQTTHAHTGFAPEHWRRALRRMFSAVVAG